MNDREDIELLAFEFVLGTLDDAERTAAAARRAREQDLDELIAHWEQRLSVLEALGDEVDPPADLFGRIESRLDATPTATMPAAPADEPAEVHVLRGRLARWRASAIAAYAVAASLVVVTAVSEVFFTPRQAHEPQQYFAVFNEGDQPPAFVMTIDLSTRELVIRPVAAGPRQGKTYQLWIASERIDDSPRSLGVLGSASAPIRRQLADFDPALLRQATFGISLEPEGGSTTGKPSGPALHGTLHPAEQ